MSKNILYLLTESPDFLPQDSVLHQVKELLESNFPKSFDINIRITENVQFIDQGQNWERVLCPLCGAELDSTGWWTKALDTAYKSNFTDLSVELPCCGALSSLNDLQYEWPAGFARCVLKVDDPWTDITDENLETPEMIGIKIA